MMTRTLLVTLLLVAVSAGGALAADEGRSRSGAKARMEALLGRIDKALDLDDEKLVQIEQILRTQGQAMQNWHKEHADEMGALRKAFAAARKAEDREKMKALGEQQKKLMAGAKTVREALPNALGDVLSAEQIKKIMPLLQHKQPDRRDQGNPLSRILGALRRLKLTEPQGKAVREIMAGHKKAMAKAETPEAKARLTAATAEKIMGVLTEAQRAALKKMKDTRPPSRGDPFVGMELSDEKRASLKKIHEDFMAATKAAKTREEKMAAYKARKAAVEGILSKEQLEQLQRRLREQHRPRRGGGDRNRDRDRDRDRDRKRGGDRDRDRRRPEPRPE